MIEAPVEAAGAVVWRPAGRDGHQVLLIHRPRYDDWSLPKGKLDPGEHPAAAAVRETREETGVEVHLGPRLTRHEYRPRPPQSGTKQVTYWSARPVDETGSGSDDHRPDDEVDAVRWVRLEEAPDVLSYPRDGVVLDHFERIVRQGAHRSVPLGVLRHAAATARKAWPGDDATRPLSDEGAAQARRLVPLLAAFGVGSLVTSETSRCVRTIEPYARAAGLDAHRHQRWGEDRARRRDVGAAVRELVAAQQPTVVCTHRPVLPWVFEGLGLSRVKLEPADLFVVHHRGGTVLDTELLRP